MSYVFRFDPADGGLTPVTGDLDRPNGLCFSPDESLLYIADSARRHVRVFTVVDGVRLEGGDVFCEIDPGFPDGMRVDTEGRLYSTAKDGLHVYLDRRRASGQDPHPRDRGKQLLLRRRRRSHALYHGEHGSPRP